MQNQRCVGGDVNFVGGTAARLFGASHDAKRRVAIGIGQGESSLAVASIDGIHDFLDIVSATVQERRGGMRENAEITEE